MTKRQQYLCERDTLEDCIDACHDNGYQTAYTFKDGSVRIEYGEYTPYYGFPDYISPSGRRLKQIRTEEVE